MQNQIEKVQIDSVAFPIDAFEFDRENGILYLKDSWVLAIADAGGHFTATNLESVLAEIGTRLEALE